MKITRRIFKYNLFSYFVLLAVVAEDLHCDNEGGCQEDEKDTATLSKFISRKNELDDLRRFLLPDGKNPLIMWWNDHLYPHYGNEKVQCNFGTCDLTADRGNFSNPNVRAIIFSGTGFDANELPLPREPYHEWALFHGESPKNNWMLSTPTGISLFNHTATFRRESDYPLSTQWIKFEENMFTKKYYVSTKEKNRYQREDGLASIVYLQRDCNPPSDRDSYVEELMKYVKIDSYGPCLNNKRMPDDVSGFVKFDKEESHKFLARYKFQLAFENAVCQDYMTEKIFRPLIIGSVPIYFGSPNITDFMPNNHSVISVRDFQSPKQLAEYIMLLDSNETLYEEYLEHKELKEITNPKLQKFIKERPWGPINKYNQMNFGYYMMSGYSCHVCDKLHERYDSIKAYLKGDIKEPPPKRVGEYKHLACPLPGKILPSSQRRFLNKDALFRENEAGAIVRMIHAREKVSSKWKEYLN